MKLKSFQRQDLARAAMHDGCILSWDTGLGKTWALYAWPLLKVGFQRVERSSELRVPEAGANASASDPQPSTLNSQLRPKAPVLLLAPGDLHQQIMAEGRTHFKVETRLLESQDAFNALGQRNTLGLPALTAGGRPLIPPGFYLTSYTQLTTNGVNALPDPDKREPIALLEELGLEIYDSRLTIDAPPEDASAPRQSPFVNRQSVKHEPDTGWPASVSAFFALRHTKRLWFEDYATFDLDYRHAVRSALEAALVRKLQAAAELPNDKWRATEERRLEAAADLLRHLIPEQLDSTGANREHRESPLLSLRPPVQLSDLSPAQLEWVTREFLRRKLAEYSAGLGETRELRVESGGVESPNPDSRPQLTTNNSQLSGAPWRVKCVSTPSLADLCYNAFDCVAIDEGVKMKGEETIVGKGVRSLEPLYRLVATATPIKNRLPDIFRLAWWASGGKAEAHARFPYSDKSSEREAFARTFLVCERNVTKEEKARAENRPTGGRYKKQTAEVCNIHRLWKLLGPVVLRRRKQDCGEDIMPKVRHVVRCELGTLQRQVYQYHLTAEYVDKNGEKAIGAQLQALRMAASDPSSQHLLRVESGGVESQGGDLAPASRFQLSTLNPQPLFRSPHSYIPKQAVTLKLIRDILARREQVLVFSAFNDPSDKLSALLREAGVRHSLLDGRTSQKRRGAAAAQFKLGRLSVESMNELRVRQAGAASAPDPQLSTLDSQPLPTPVLLAGVECMAEGHSFHRCNNVILIAYSWAYDKFKQALDRVHRLNSERPINVYVVLCAGTIDRKLESLVQEKGDAADLVLDGQLLGERTEEINFAELLAVAREEFDPQDATIPEAVLQAEWPQLRHELAQAMTAWDGVEQLSVASGGVESQTQDPAPVPTLNFQLSTAVQTPAPGVGRVALRPPREPVPALEHTNEAATILPFPTPQLSTLNPQLPATWRDRLKDRARRLQSLSEHLSAAALF